MSEKLSLDDSPSNERRPKRAGGARRIGLAVGVMVAALAASQSVTITPPIESRVVDEGGAPVDGVQIVAAWKLQYATVGGAIPGATLRVQTAQTSTDGRFRIPGAVLFHAPVAPFSLLYRSDSRMPLLLGCKRGVGILGAASNRDAFPGLLSFRRTGLGGVDLQLRPASPIDTTAMMSVKSAMIEAETECKQSATCGRVNVDSALQSCSDAISGD